MFKVVICTLVSGAAEKRLHCQDSNFQMVDNATVIRGRDPRAPNLSMGGSDGVLSHLSVTATLSNHVSICDLMHAEECR